MRIFILYLLLSGILMAEAQPFRNFYQNHLKPSKSTQSAAFTTEIYPQFFLAGGGGVLLSGEWSRFQLGAMYWTVPVGEGIRDAIFQNANNIQIDRNFSFEIFGNVYLSKNRKGFYAGFLAGPEWFDLTDLPSGEQIRVRKTYMVMPKIGFRWFPFGKYFFLDGEYGLAWSLSSLDQIPIGESQITPNRNLGIPFFSMGIRWNE